MFRRLFLGLMLLGVLAGQSQAAFLIGPGGYQNNYSGTKILEPWTNYNSLDPALAGTDPKKIDLSWTAPVGYNGLAYNAWFIVGQPNSSNPSQALLESITGQTSNTLSQVFKYEVDGSNYSGSLANSYEFASVSDAELDPEKGSFVYQGGSSASAGTGSLYALFKDGTTGHYLFDISMWNGTDTLVFEGLWPESGNLSNMQLWTGPAQGASGGVPVVPEPTSVTLWALGGLAMVGLRRRRA